jgi:hypothetical protein
LGNFHIGNRFVSTHEADRMAEQFVRQYGDENHREMELAYQEAEQSSKYLSLSFFLFLLTLTFSLFPNRNGSRF